MPSNKDAAIALAAAGLTVFPLIKKNQPKGKWSGVEYTADWKVGLNWIETDLPAVACGKSGIVVIDCDTPDKPGKADGVAAFDELCKREGLDRSSWFVVRTPSFGYHYYFRTTIPFTTCTNHPCEGIDIRGEGGYAVGVGAILPDGSLYERVNGSLAAIPELPEALAKYLKARGSTPVPQGAIAKTSGTLIPPPLPTHAPSASGEALPSVVTGADRAWAETALKEWVKELSALVAGNGRNDRLNKAAMTMAGYIGNGSIDVQHVADELYAASVTNGHVAKRGHLQTVKTINSGFTAGMKKPFKLLAEKTPSIDTNALVDSGMASSGASMKVKRKVRLKRIDQYEDLAITWLWEGFLARGTYTMLAGAIQAGKSTIAMSFAATVTTGGRWPDGTLCASPGNVIFWSSEEVISTVVKPRLTAAGADLSRIHVIEESVNEHNEPCPFDPTQDIARLREEITAIGGASLVIIDPLISAVDGDTNKANDVRRALQPVVTLAEEFDCVVLGIHHIAKNSEGKAANDRALGSQAFTAMARVVLMATKVQDSEERVFAISKSNISRDNGGFNYVIEPVSFPSRSGASIKTSRIKWGEAVHGSAQAIMAQAEGDTNEDTTKLGQAKKFLLESLQGGKVGSRELFREARNGHGIAEKTLRRAGEALKIVPQHDPLMDGGWSWSLPDTTPHFAQNYPKLPQDGQAFPRL